MTMTTLSEVHDSSTCNAANGQPCPMCAAAIEYETQQVISRVHQMMSEDCDCEVHRHQIALPTFDDDWELAPLSRTRCVERSDAEYWYRMGGKAMRERMLVEQNADMREML